MPPPLAVSFFMHDGILPGERREKHRERRTIPTGRRGERAIIISLKLELIVSLFVSFVAVK